MNTEKNTKTTMKRLRGLDYRRPFFYMVTIKRRQGLKAFSQIVDAREPPKDARGRGRYLVANEITPAFTRVITEFAGKWWGLWPIDCFIIMPDHLHLLIHLKDTGDQMALGSYVYQLMKALSIEYWRVVGGGCGGGVGSGPGGGVGRGPGGRSRQDNTLMESEMPAKIRVGSAIIATPRGREGGNTINNQSVVLPAPSGNIPLPAPSGNALAVAPVFERDWHDWIVKKDGQLAAFTRYIRETPIAPGCGD